MSATEATTAAPAPVNAPETVETTATPNKFDNVGKTVGGKVKGLFKVINTAGEHLRGNINAALDGAGDAIAGRKSGEAPVAGETSEPVAQGSTVPAAAAAPADVAPATEAAATTTATNAAPGQKQFPVGQFINKSLKRTVTLIKNVTNNLRSNVNSGVNGVGNTLSQQKDRASKRFSRAPRAEPVAAPVEAASVAPEAPTVAPTNTNAEIVPATAPAVQA
ncbi:hypothetical protein DFH28DRAFT_1224710 [Melampsora americana]|nr:hypothetical protein DFH28DRAFT_1224710 [Melampsora americana]